MIIDAIGYLAEDCGATLPDGPGHIIQKFLITTPASRRHVTKTGKR
jgi:hypothetical protein